MPNVKKQTAKVKRKPEAKKKVTGIEAKLKDMEFCEGIKICIYGRSGTGKTSLWGSFPGPIACIQCSGGSKPGELRTLNTPEMRKKIKTFVLEETSEIRDLVELQEETGRFKTIVIDHATGLQDTTLAEVLDLDEIPAQNSWGLASQQDYGQCSLQMKTNLRMLLGLACNVVIIAQEREFTPSEDDGMIMPHVAAALSPSVAGWLNPACDYVVETFIRQKTIVKKVKVGGKTTEVRKPTKGVEYCLRTGPHAVYTTKFRIPKGSGELPDVIVDPDYMKILKLIEGGQ